MTKRHPDEQVVAGRALTPHEALQLICATTGSEGHAVGHWHGVCLKIARAALFDYPPELWVKDWKKIAEGLPPRSLDGLELSNSSGATENANA